MRSSDIKRYKMFRDLTFADFERMAQDESLSKYEKIGFPEEYRKEHEEIIFQDILSKLPSIMEKHKTILDIGCGCSELPQLLIDKCESNNHKLVLCDSQAMLALLPDRSFIHKICGRFPDNFILFKEYEGKVDVILVYSVLQHIIIDMNAFSFIDKCLELLGSRGVLLIGDIPNISKRNRFFSSAEGALFHQQFTQSQTLPDIKLLFEIPHNKIDDGVIFGILHRYRNFGFETYLLPHILQNHFYNRRENIMIVKR